MGYHTELFGSLTLDRPAAKEDIELVNQLTETRRMARNVDEKYGVEGEFYVDGGGMLGQDFEDNIIDYNRPPKTQPGLWCMWRLTPDGKELVWDQEEKPQNYVEWLQYLIDKIFEPKNYKLNGVIEWAGEDLYDRGTVIVKDNKLSVFTDNGDEDARGRVRAVLIAAGVDEFGDVLVDKLIKAARDE